MRHRVLHVSEAFGGGIVSSLFSFAQSTPEIEHHLLVCEREDEPLAKNLSDCFASTTLMRKSLLGARRDIMRKVAELRPAFVHLHSTYAGVYGRIAGLNPAMLVYSPHGFSFQRESDAKPLRIAYYALEKMLSRRAANFAGVSLDEVRLSHELNFRLRSIFVPNVTDVARRPVGAVIDEERIVVVAMGRLHPQKDPYFLAETLRRLPPAVRNRLEVTWVGSGDEAMTAALIKQGVTITGWMSHADASAKLARCDLYIHFAAWEGFPMTVIEAAAMGRPILLRAISAFDGFELPARALVETPDNAAQRLMEWVENPASRQDTYALIDKVRAICGRDRQAAALRKLYQVGGL